MPVQRLRRVQPQPAAAGNVHVGSDSAGDHDIHIVLPFALSVQFFACLDLAQACQLHQLVKVLPRQFLEPGDRLKFSDQLFPRGVHAILSI
jgi:hypothetical protein